MSVPTVSLAAPITPPKRSAFSIERPGRTERRLKAMIYGDYGAGKTTLAATSYDVASMRDVLLIDAEAGDLSLVGKYDDIDRIGVTKYKVFSQILEYLRVHCRLRDDPSPEAVKKLCDLEESLRGETVTHPRRYRTVIIDSLTEVQKYCMYQILNIDISTQKLDAAIGAPEYKEWGQNSELIRLLVRSFKELDMNVLFICPEAKNEDDSKRQLRYPNLPGKLASEVQGFLDMVGYLSLVNVEGKTTRKLFLEPAAGRIIFQAKNRFGNSGIAAIEEPTMAKILATYQVPGRAAQKPTHPAGTSAK